MVKKILGCFLLMMVVGFSPSQAQSAKDRWVDSLFNGMSIEERIGQLLMISVSPDKSESQLNALENRVKSGVLGGILFTSKKHSNPGQLVSRLQSGASVPLLFGIDDSGSLETHHDSTFTFPSVIAQGALADDSLIYKMGSAVGRKMSRMGIHLTFIPANLASPRYPLSYGEDRFAVASKSMAYWKGLQSEGVLACARSFPIQGLSITDIHKGVPSVHLAVDSLEAYPFRVLLKNNLPALMPASADLPLFYSKRKTAARNTFSSSTLTTSFAGDWIRQNMNYKGVILIDVDHMARSSDKFGSGDAEVFAFQAGNDMMITSSNASAIVRKMKRLFRKQEELLPQLERSVKKILALKYDAGLYRKEQSQLPEPYLLKTKLLSLNMYRAAITVLSNQQDVLPVKALEDKKFICLIADDSVKGKTFSARLSKYIQTSVITISEKTDTLNLTDTLIRKQVVIVGLFPSTRQSTFRKILPLLHDRNPDHEVIICDFGAPFFKSLTQDFPTVITAYSDDYEMLVSVPEVLFGGLPAQGISPVAFGSIPSGRSIKTAALDRLTYSFPEEVGMDGKTLTKIEAIAKEAIDMGATPGCHVLIAKDGKVIYERSFGYLTYEKQVPVTDQTLYDLASVTKVSATLQALMFLYDRGQFDVNKKASVYLPELKRSNKKDFILKDVLTHQAGLLPFIPFWAQTMKDSLHMPEYYSHTLSEAYPFVVADNLYAAHTMKDSLWTWIVKSKIREKPQRTPFDYRYSDMGFYIGQHLAERLLNQPMEDFLNQNLYEPLGASSTGYLPLLRYPIHQIAPTENDKLFRKALLIGTVHDQGAAMHGGIAGHAGLFSNANDLAKLGQMLLQEGYYGGTRYYRSETVRLFTQKQFASSRRGLGWDKPTPGDWNGPTCYAASPKTFGHTGFTGTCIWVDPEFKVVYIFLSNRVHPDMTNNKLLNANIRSRVQDVIYQSIFNYCRTAGGEPHAPQSQAIEILGSHNK